LFAAWSDCLSLRCRSTGCSARRPASAARRSAPPRRPGAVGYTFVTVRFRAPISPDLGWDFRLLESAVRVHPGEQREVFFRAVNRTSETVTGTATFNVTPTKTGIYFDKLQCFCFNEQQLKPGESRDMGVVFFVDPDLLTDPSTSDVRTITLSYTMFRAPAASQPNAAVSPRTKDSAVN
jgi:cytochrome c oxidase assembly protein subunit 11